MIHQDIATAIAEAFQAHAEKPDLEATIKRLLDELDLAKYELEEQAKEMAKLNQTIGDLHSDRNSLRDQLDEANKRVTFLTGEAESAETINRRQGHKIMELQTDLDAKQILEGALRDDKAALERQLADTKSVADRFRQMLSRIMGEVKEVLPASEVAPAATFHVVDGAAKPSADREGPHPVVGANPMADEVKAKSLWEF
jgi:chromosome segregation ATPase